MSEGSDDRTAMMIRQLTKGGAEQLTKWQSTPGRVAVLLAEKSIEYPNARLCLAMAINALARVYPVITDLHIILHRAARKVNAPLFSGKNLRDCIDSFIKKLQPDVNVQIRADLDRDYDALLSIGNSGTNHEFKVCVASDGWLAYTGRDSVNAEFTDNFNPVGAYLAACLGSIEVFKKILVKKADIINPEKSDYDFRWNVRFLDRQLKFNGFDYSINSGNSPNPLLPDLIDLGECVIAGVGAGGGACLHALASLPSLKGILHLVDPDEVKPSNLNRYVYAVRVDADKKRPKVTVAKQLFRSSQVKVHKYHEAYSQFSKSLNGKSVELIVSTVDTSGTRVDIQWDLPKIILDAAVAGTQFYIKKVELGRTPCLGCTHSPQDSSGSIESKLSIVIGLPATMITELRKDNRAIEEEHIQLMKPFSKKYGFELPQPGEHFQDWYLYHCGQIPLGQGEIQIPVPFATIMPGILLAGEIIKKNHFGDHLVRDYFAYDIFGAPMDIAEIINRRQDCPICADLATIARYKKKHMLI